MVKRDAGSSYHGIGVRVWLISDLSDRNLRYGFLFVLLLASMFVIIILRKDVIPMW